ncbi:MAG: threonine-phosphate decarboxylase CobD, partial [Gammaproteobacteria bacterium]|nr:threonine-phosphate decarboxylase CobD [Gammaproteobacteria bacterium]
MLNHGGKLRDAAQHYGIEYDRWIDLSTGINPHGYPIAPLEAHHWQRLPELRDGLEAAASHYYGTDNLLATAGSQAIIQALPELLFQGKNRAEICIGLLEPSYQEHGHCWQQAGYRVKRLSSKQIMSASEKTKAQLDALILVNPNNPTGQRFSSDCLHRWQHHLHHKGGYLIVDEAFIDVTPEASLLKPQAPAGLIVLRSLGKFFGLAGARIGFLFAQPELLHQMREHLGPWSISGPSRVVACAALSDFAWQEQMRQQLKSEGERLKQLLEQHGFANNGTAL